MVTSEETDITTGLVTVDGCEYYFYGNDTEKPGAMAVSTTVGGYYVNANGEYIP